jgi:ankyrin repeat protein
MPPPPPPTRPGKKQIQVVKALYSYQAQRPDELDFEQDDILYVLQKDSEWWLCRVGTRQGLVPSNYVGENTLEMDQPLHEAAKRGNVEFVKELLQQGLSPNGILYS